MLAAIANGTTQITGFLPGEDCLATLGALRDLGIAVHQTDPRTLEVLGQGKFGLTGPTQSLNLGNSGTAMRLFMGLLSGQDFSSRLIGDPSLSRRPMERVAQPLRTMGAVLQTAEERLPLPFGAGQNSRGSPSKCRWPVPRSSLRCCWPGCMPREKLG